MSDTTSKSGDYVAVLTGLWPLLLTAFLVSLFRMWSHVRKSYLQDHFWATVLNTLVSSAFMAFFAVGVALLMPLAGFDMSPEAEVGVVAFVSGAGMKLVDALIRKKLGLEISEKEK